MSDKPTRSPDDIQPDPQLDTLRKLGRDLLKDVSAEPVPQGLRDAAAALGDALDERRASDSVPMPRTTQ